MEYAEHRRYLRHETEIGVTLHKEGDKIPATLVDISRGGIGLISDQILTPGLKVKVTINYIGDFAILGTVKWSVSTKEPERRYRVGIEADQILIPEDIMNWQADNAETPFSG